MKYLSILCILTSITMLCNEKIFSQEKAKAEILNVVKTHNTAWAVNENIDEQMKYIHDDVQMISPPYQKVIKGKQEYKEGYLDWMKHATVHYFHENNPEVTILKDRKTAFVVYQIEMSFDFDSVKVEKWEGIDFMVLIKENKNWKIISDMYTKK